MDKHERIQLFTETIWNWYSIHKRELPWRDLKDSDPTARAYKILVSEVMLQQTQVSRVKIVFRDFLEKFPKISDLGSASNRDVLLAWRGMGYNSRALRLRDAAKAIVEQFEKKFPESMEDLLAIKGIGSYTAAAIRNFAFNIPTPCIDTNIRRILHRTFVGPENADGTWKKDDQFLLSLAREVLDTAISPPPSEEGLGVEEKQQTKQLVIELPQHLLSNIIPKGSITIDGVSLTIAHIEGNRITIALIPLTLEQTTLGSLKKGDRVNIETDVLVRSAHATIPSF